MENIILALLANTNEINLLNQQLVEIYKILKDING